MRVIIRAIIAVVVIFVTAHFLNQQKNLSTIDYYKNKVMDSKPVQELLNSEPVQKIRHIDLEELLPSDFF
ncbi:hypothetical protein GZH82_02485 [Staphylococcus ursi]|uniref:hypothetical protein n=1 Tax=Staphylococcus sp. MI 10-1553 TaxID=1912064 RepID=UPI001396F498|nr:hypothetical protein [Staphylococcus sp. MI 10-1553]QHW36308.1 hypothetical protein GZH82_02485 [Staphylococcus sp. MI 10-1553]